MEVLAPGTLYIVSTPIGNLGDITARAGHVLGACDFVLAEDTRTTRGLLTHLGISARLVSLREHNEARVTARVVKKLRDGATAALVSDAGTPLVSDPGERLVRGVLEAGLPVVPVPGASALLAALVASGLPAVPVTFFGFLPRKGTERAATVAALKALRHTAVVYESAERIADTLAELAAAGFAARRGATCRELTKRFEEIRRGTVEELAAYHSASPPRGELVLVLDGAPPDAPDEARLAARARAWRGEGVPARDVARRLSEEFGVSRNLAYRLAHE